MDNNEIRKQMELEQKRAFCKQSCTKIDQGLDKLDPRSGERAIWELFQNARDLAQPDADGIKRAYIKVSLTPSEFIFAHQGLPFDHDSLTSLVMQVSSQGKENDDTVGQYGTGFLTTHVFGRKLHLSGSFDLAPYMPGSFVDINRFEIDRTYDNITEFVEKVALQLVAVNDFADAPKTAAPRKWTELCYDLSSAENASEKASASITSAVEVIPYVMTVNKRIASVIIENKITGDSYIFEKKRLEDEAGLKVMQVRIYHNGVASERKIYYLESEDEEDVAILPLESPTKAKSLRNIAKLFVFFPLLGTEDFGMDVVFHSKKFIPVEERDGLHVPVTNANVRAKYEQNVRVLNSLTDMVFQYYSTHLKDISNLVEVMGLSFDCVHHKEDVTKDFFTNFKGKWSRFYLNQPIVDIANERMSVNNSAVRFFAPTIVADIDNDENNCPEYFTALYDAAVLCNILPTRSEIIGWSKVIASWDSDHRSLLDVNEIAQNLSASDNASIQHLYAFDNYISQKGFMTLFDNYALLPNRDGVKKKKAELRNADSIPTYLSDIAKSIVPEKVASFVDDSFKNLTSLTVFTRNDLREAINGFLTNLRRDKLDKGVNYPTSVLDTLLNLSTVFASESASAVRRSAIDVIAKYMGKEPVQHILQPIDSNERDIADLPFKHLVENLFLEISVNSSEWVYSNMDYILSLHSVLSSWAEYYNRNNGDGLCVKYGAFPNRNGNPTIARELKKGVDISDDLASLYTEVLNLDLNERLVEERFEQFYEFETITSKDIANEIETKLEEDGFQHTAVLDIINRLSDDCVWEKWFPRIAEKKAELFLNQVRDDCKEGVFKLMKINNPEKLNQLAELADEINLDEIIEKGKSAVLARKNQEADFNFKLDLGKYVERMLHEYLSHVLSTNEVTVETEQYGADLSICKNGYPIYYIEIKSRWGSDQSVMMSPLQMKESVDELGNYALCCVDMSHMGLDTNEEHQYPELKAVIPYIKALPNIGLLNKKIVDTAFQTDSQDVYIGGDYKCIIPQRTIAKTGVDFNALISIIANLIQEKDSDVI